MKKIIIPRGHQQCPNCNGGWIMAACGNVQCKLCKTKGYLSNSKMKKIKMLKQLDLDHDKLYKEIWQ